MAVLQGQAHSATMEKWPTTPDQGQRKPESPLASFPLSPRQHPGVGTGGAGGIMKKQNWEKDCGRPGKGASPSTAGPSPFLSSGVPSLLWVH